MCSADQNRVKSQHLSHSVFSGEEKAHIVLLELLLQNAVPFNYINAVVNAATAGGEINEVGSLLL